MSNQRPHGREEVFEESVDICWRILSITYYRAGSNGYRCHLMKHRKQTTIQPLIQEPSSIPQMAYTPEEAAMALNMGITNTRALIKSGQLKSFPVGKTKRLVPVTAIQEYMDRASGTTTVPQNLPMTAHRASQREKPGFHSWR